MIAEKHMCNIEEKTKQTNKQKTNIGEFENFEFEKILFFKQSVYDQTGQPYRMRRFFTI